MFCLPPTSSCLGLKRVQRQDKGTDKSPSPCLGTQHHQRLDVWQRNRNINMYPIPHTHILMRLLFRCKIIPLFRYMYASLKVALAFGSVDDTFRFPAFPCRKLAHKWSKTIFLIACYCKTNISLRITKKLSEERYGGRVWLDNILQPNACDRLHSRIF